MRKILIHAQPDGTVVETAICPEYYDWVRRGNPISLPDGTGGHVLVQPAPGLDHESIHQIAVAVAIPLDVSIYEVDPHDLPLEVFRDSWRVVGGRVVIDMPLARQQRMNEIRAERDKRLAATDGIFLSAQEQNRANEIAELKAKRQALRDIPQSINLDSITTPDELAAFEPEWP